MSLYNVKLSPEERREVAELFEEAQIRWRRDWDALLLGVLLGGIVAGFAIMIVFMASR